MLQQTRRVPTSIWWRLMAYQKHTFFVGQHVSLSTSPEIIDEPTFCCDTSIHCYRRESETGNTRKSFLDFVNNNFSSRSKIWMKFGNSIRVHIKIFDQLNSKENIFPGGRFSNSFLFIKFWLNSFGFRREIFTWQCRLCHLNEIRTTNTRMDPGHGVNLTRN